MSERKKITLIVTAQELACLECVANVLNVPIAELPSLVIAKQLVGHVRISYDSAKPYNKRDALMALVHKVHKVHP